MKDKDLGSSVKLKGKLMTCLEKSKGKRTADEDFHFAIWNNHKRLGSQYTGITPVTVYTPLFVHEQ